MNCHFAGHRPRLQYCEGGAPAAPAGAVENCGLLRTLRFVVQYGKTEEGCKLEMAGCMGCQRFMALCRGVDGV